MPMLPQRLNSARMLTPGLAHAALDAALRHSGPKERPAILAELLALADHRAVPGPRGLSGAFSIWNELDADSRLALLGCAGHEAARLVLPLIESGDPRDRRLGSMIAADLTLQRCDPKSPIRGPVEPGLDRALAAAGAHHGEHRLPEVLDALMAVAESPGPAVRAFFSREMHEVHMPLRAAARRAAETAPLRTLVAWLALDPLAAVAREFIEKRAAIPLHGDSMLEHSHLLLSSKRLAAARRIQRPERLFSKQQSIARLAEPDRRGVIRLLRILSVPPAHLIETLQDLLTDPAVSVRLDAVRALASAPPTPAGDTLLRDFAFDEHAAPASAAASALARAESPARREALTSFFASLQRSPHKAVRVIAESAVRQRSSQQRNTPRPLARPGALAR